MADLASVTLYGQVENALSSLLTGGLTRNPHKVNRDLSTGALLQHYSVQFVSSLWELLVPARTPQAIIEVLMPKVKRPAGPRTGRPRIPGYGISKSKTGILPWEWAVKMLAKSREYWICTVRSDGRPHAMIIWGLWFEGAFWFGTGSQTQKAHNLAKNPNCVVGTQNAAEAVIVEGVAELVTDTEVKRKLKPVSLRKYGISGGGDSEPLYRVRPRRAFGLIEKTFPKTATRWTFD